MSTKGNRHDLPESRLRFRSLAPVRRLARSRLENFGFRRCP